MQALKDKISFPFGGDYLLRVRGVRHNDASSCEVQFHVTGQKNLTQTFLVSWTFDNILLSLFLR